jgi:hypothetical protein
MWQNMDAKMGLRLHDQDLRRAMIAARGAGRAQPSRFGVADRSGAIRAALGRGMRAILVSLRSLRGSAGRAA